MPPPTTRTLVVRVQRGEAHAVEADRQRLDQRAASRAMSPAGSGWAFAAGTVIVSAYPPGAAGVQP